MTILETERLVLRELEAEIDAAFINQLLNTPKFLLHIGDRGVRTDDEARLFIKDRYCKSYRDHGYGLYAVETKDTGAKVGMCGFVRRDSLPGPDIGFAFLPEFEGRGYGLESAAAMMEYGRETLGFGHVFAITTLDNTASIKLLKKLGFELDRVLEEPGEQRLNLFSFRFLQP